MRWGGSTRAASARPVAVGVVLLGLLVGVIAAGVHAGVAYAIGVAILAAGAGAVVAAWSVPAGLLVAVVVLLAAAGLPWLAHHREVGGGETWSVRGRPTNLVVVGDRVLESDLDGVTIVDAGSGRQVRRAFDAAGTMFVAENGALFSLKDGTVRAYSADGERRWRRSLPNDRVEIAAATPAATVLFACPHGKGPCRMLGVGADGRTLWRRTGVAMFQHHTDDELPEHTDFDSPRLPAVPGLRDGNGVVLLDPATGRAVARTGHVASVGAAPGGVTVISHSPRHGTCVFTAQRGREVRWTARIPCRAYLGLYMLAHRAYGAGDDGSVTIDLATGRWRRVPGRPEVFGLGDEAVAAIPGEDVIVERRDTHITAVDAATGKTLWKHTVPGTRPPGVEVGRGTVSVLTGVSGWNPFLSHEERQGQRLTTYDARTGKRLGSIVVPVQVLDSLPLDHGRTLVIALSGVHRVIG